MTAAAEALAVDRARGMSVATRAWRSGRRRRFMSNVPATLGLVLLLGLAIASLVGPLLTMDPTDVDLRARLQGPSAAHLLGTDQLGRDLLARVLAGGQVSFTVAIASTLVALTTAMVIGMTAGYFGGLVDELLSRVLDVLLTFPALLLAIIIVAAIGPSLSSVVLAIGIAYVPRYGRLFRALTLATRQLEYVEGARALGYSSPRVLARHILPNILVAVLVVAAGNMGRVALAEASLSFLGAGVQPPAASWGNMIAEEQQLLQYFPWLPLVPGVALTIVTISFAFVGDGLRDAFDVRETSLRVGS